MTAKPRKIAPIPRGFRSLTPHVAVPDVAAAVALYQTALGADAVAVDTAWTDGPAVFAQLRIGNSMLTVGQGPLAAPGALSLHLYVEDIDALWTNATGAGFTPLTALEDTYWGDRMGVLADPFGVTWSLGQRVMHLTAAERAERAAQAMGHLPPLAEETPAAAPLH